MADAKEKARIENLVENVNDSITEVEEALKPILEQGIEEYAAKLPALERAKFYTLITYSLNSIIFMCQKLEGRDPRQLPVYAELQRCRQYFEKIKTAEESKDSPAKPSATLDKAAANRFIKQGLSGNERFDEQWANDQKRRKVNAHIKFDQVTGQDQSGETATTTATDKSASTIDDKNSSASKASLATGHHEDDTVSADTQNFRKHSNRQKGRHKSSSAPRSHKEAMQHLLQKAYGNG